MGGGFKLRNMKQTMKTKLSIFLTVMMTALLVGCGGNGEPAGTRSTGSDGSQAAGDAREIVIEGNDQMQFDINSFDVEAGERIRLTLKNVGTMPKFSMGHNVVILQRGADGAAFVEAAMNAAANDYIPQGSENQIIAHTALLGGGEEDSITFTAPQTTGEYPYVCSFPGHYQIGMHGVMNVR